jgi:hypothetical protein
LGGIRALVKETLQSPKPFHHMTTQQEVDICEPDTKSARALSLNFSASRTMRNKHLLLINNSLWDEDETPIP